MSISFESIEAALRSVPPRAVAKGVARRLADAMNAPSDVDSRLAELSPEQRLVEARLKCFEPKSLHPQQREVMNQAQLEGSCEANWAELCRPVDLSVKFSEQVILELDSLAQVQTVQPASLRPELLDQLVAEMDAVSQVSESTAVAPSQASREGQILAFPGRERQQKSSVSSSLLKIAAMVAVIGAAVGSLLPEFNQDTSPLGSTAQISDNNEVSSLSSEEEPIEPRLPAYASLVSPLLVPASLDSEVRSPKVGGVVLDQVNRAHRQVEFQQVERMLLIDEQGRPREFERPMGVRQCLLPVQTQ